MSHWMFRCDEVSRKVSQSMDAPLSLQQRIAVRIHLMMCRHCARFRRQLAMLRRMSRMFEGRSAGEGLSAEAKARIIASLQSLS